MMRGMGSMADHGSESGAIGGPVRHIPVMLAEVLRYLAPAPGAVVLDGTFGAGGYTRALLDAGAQVSFGPRDQVLRDLVRNHTAIVGPPAARGPA